MRKSPFSTPRGNANGRPGSGWHSGGSPRRGYGRPKNYDFSSPNHSHDSSQSFSDDFIPFNSSPAQSSERQSGGNWSSPVGGNWLSPGRGNHRQSFSPGFNNSVNNNWRDNHRGPRSFKDGRNSLRGKNKNYHRGNAQKNFDISRYMNIRSFLEDPWAELLRDFKTSSKFDDSTNELQSDLSFNSSILDVVRLDDSVEEGNISSTDPSSQGGNNDSSAELENSDLPLSERPVENKSSLDPKTSQDTKD